MSKTKRRLLTGGLAVTVVSALLIGGGTTAYLSSSAEPVQNVIATNEVEVELTETGAVSGVNDSYEVIPGTSEEKDPTVTITSTLDSYLYVLVYGYNPTFTYEDESGTAVTENIVAYEIEDGWTILPYDTASTSGGANDSYSDDVLKNFGLTSTDLDGTTEVTIYYREVSADDNEQTFTVLKNNEISYSAEITDMSAYTDDIYLTFAAYAIQKEPFNDPEKAMTKTTPAAKIGNIYYETLSEAIEAASSGETITLLADAEAAITVTSGDTLTLDLNGYTLTGSVSVDSYYYPNVSTVNIKNGNIVLTKKGGIYNYGTMNLENLTITQDNVTISTYETTALVSNGGTITMTDCEINAGDYMGTVISNYEGTMTINSGTYTSDVTGNSLASLINNNTGTLIINGGTFTCNSTRSVIECEYSTGTITVNDGTFTTNGNLFFTCYCTVNINGGTFTCGSGASYKMIYYRNQDKYLPTVSITGGTYSKTVEDYVADGYAQTDNGDGTYTVAAE